ncbi:MAG: hypothetical protein R2765_03385 [Ferruginibacter sp.]
MKKLLLGAILLLGSVGIVSAQSEDRDPRAPKAEKAAPAATVVSAKQDDIYSSKKEFRSHHLEHSQKPKMHATEKP